jgi:16S rRNA (guanine966-N2)-methyltransferase
MGKCRDQVRVLVYLKPHIKSTGIYILKQSIRIIGGLYRGKKLQFPESKDLRPTPNRVRETLFNWLMQDTQEAHCLDAFSGSGALGLEAFSRGAATVVFLEESPKICENLQTIITSFHSPNLKLIQTDALLYLQQDSGKPFDLIFLDPPFRENYIPQCLELIVQHKRLVPGGFVYFESSSPIEIDLQEWNPIKSKQAGQVSYGLLQKLKQA